ncbi:hypothetical protein E4T56_gene9815 [Termitomyces sp. T112]|nr:hypothetical protein E4T56_gene9815 [Termitomyces sp. T112]
MRFINITFASVLFFQVLLCGVSAAPLRNTNSSLSKAQTTNTPHNISSVINISANKSSTQQLHAPAPGACPSQQHLSKRSGYLTPPNPASNQLHAAINWALQHRLCPAPSPYFNFVQCRTQYPGKGDAILKMIFNSNVNTVAKEVQHLMAVNMFYAWGEGCNSGHQVFFIAMPFVQGAYGHAEMERIDHRFVEPDLDYVLGLQDVAILRYYKDSGIIKRNLMWTMDFVYRQDKDGQWEAHIIDWAQALFTGRKGEPNAYGPSGPFLLIPDPQAPQTHYPQAHYPQAQYSQAHYPQTQYPQAYYPQH